MAGHSLPVSWTVAEGFSAREGTEAIYLRFVLTGIKNGQESKVEGKSAVSTERAKEKKKSTRDRRFKFCHFLNLASSL